MATDGDGPPKGFTAAPAKGLPVGEGPPNGFANDGAAPAKGLPVGDGPPKDWPAGGPPNGVAVDDEGPPNGLTGGGGGPPNGFGDDEPPNGLPGGGGGPPNGFGDDEPPNGLPGGGGGPPNGFGDDEPPNGLPGGGPPKGLPGGDGAPSGPAGDGAPKGLPGGTVGRGVGATGAAAANGSVAGRRMTFWAPHLGHCARTPRSEISASSMTKAAVQASQSIRMIQPYRRGQTDATTRVDGVSIPHFGLALRLAGRWRPSADGSRAPLTLSMGRRCRGRSSDDSAPHTPRQRRPG